MDEKTPDDKDQCFFWRKTCSQNVNLMSEDINVLIVSGKKCSFSSEQKVWWLLMDWISLRPFLLLEHQTVLKTPFLALFLPFSLPVFTSCPPVCQDAKINATLAQTDVHVAEIDTVFSNQGYHSQNVRKIVVLGAQQSFDPGNFNNMESCFLLFCCFSKKKLTFMLYMPLLWCKYPINIPLGTDWPSFHWRKSINCPHKKCK